jgi:hypothetical protein
LQPQGCYWVALRVSGCGAVRPSLHLLRDLSVGRAWCLGRQGFSCTVKPLGGSTQGRCQLRRQQGQSTAGGMRPSKTRQAGSDQPG